MSDGLSDYYASSVYDDRLAGRSPRMMEQFPDIRSARSALYEMWQSDDRRPIVPRITEHGRMMWAADLGLPSNNTPAYFWLGREAEA